MMRTGILTAVIVLLATADTRAEGWADLAGVNKRGDAFSPVPTFVDKPGEAAVSEPFGSFSIYVRLEGASIDDVEVYENEPCVLSTDRTSGTPMLFACSDRAKSPLRGTRYIAVPNPDPNDCAYSFRFVCVQGCESDEAPQTLDRGFWECELPE